MSGIEWQSAMYAEGLPAGVRLKALTVDGRLPFVLDASGTEAHFTNGFDPDRDAEANEGIATWRAKVRAMPTLDHTPMRPAQITAIDGVERSLAEQRFDRSLVHMATSGSRV